MLPGRPLGALRIPDLHMSYNMMLMQQPYRQTDRQTDKQIDRVLGLGVYIYIYIYTQREGGIQIYIYIYIYIYGGDEPKYEAPDS